MAVKTKAVRAQCSKCGRTVIILKDKLGTRCNVVLDTYRTGKGNKRPWSKKHPWTEKCRKKVKRCRGKLREIQ